MPIKNKIRTHKMQHPAPRRGGLIQGQSPHRRRNAHSVIRKWPYVRASLVWLMAMVLVLLALGIFGYGVWLKLPKVIYLAIALLVFWLFMRLMFLFAAKATRCPLCRANHMSNTQSNKHKNAYKIFPFSYASTAVLTAIFKRCIRCMHCGVTFDLNKKQR